MDVVAEVRGVLRTGVDIGGVGEGEVDVGAKEARDDVVVLLYVAMEQGLL